MKICAQLSAQLLSLYSTKNTPRHFPLKHWTHHTTFPRNAGSYYLFHLDLGLNVSTSSVRVRWSRADLNPIWLSLYKQIVNESIISTRTPLFLALNSFQLFLRCVFEKAPRIFFMAPLMIRNIQKILSP